MLDNLDVPFPWLPFAALIAEQCAFIDSEESSGPFSRNSQFSILGLKPFSEGASFVSQRVVPQKVDDFRPVAGLGFLAVFFPVDDSAEADSDPDSDLSLVKPKLMPPLLEVLTQGFGLADVR